MASQTTSPPGPPGSPGAEAGPGTPSGRWRVGRVETLPRSLTRSWGVSEVCGGQRSGKDSRDGPAAEGMRPSRGLLGSWRLLVEAPPQVLTALPHPPSLLCAPPWSPGLEPPGRVSCGPWSRCRRGHGRGPSEAGRERTPGGHRDGPTPLHGASTPPGSRGARRSGESGSCPVGPPAVTWREIITSVCGPHRPPRSWTAPPESWGVGWQAAQHTQPEGTWVPSDPSPPPPCRTQAQLTESSLMHGEHGAARCSGNRAA